MQLQVRHHRVSSETSPLVMGILNVTPDSFSDGGEYLAPQDAVDRAWRMIAEGADIIDIGPESTRPGARPVSANEQISRALPVIEAIRSRDDRIAISIDTRVASVARAALQAGADIVNDVSALRDDADMVDVVAASGAAVVLMHMRGVPADMQRDGGPAYDDVVGEIAAFLGERRQHAVSRGVDRSRVILDPGIGFGKRVEHNLLIMRCLDRLLSIGQPLLIGASRKSFIGHVLGTADPKDRMAGSLCCAAIAVMAGVSILRVHDVLPTVQAVRLCAAVRQAGSVVNQPRTHPRR